MKIAIAGAGAVGQHIATVLIADGHEVTLFESDDAVVERALRRIPGAEVIVADACEVRSLEAADLASFDAMVAATGDDEDNLVISLLSKQEFAIPRVLARVNNPKNQRLFTSDWGVDTPLSVPHLIAGLVAEEVTTGKIVELMQLRNRARIIEVNLAANSPLVGQTIAALDLPRAFTFVAVIRDGSVIFPRGDTQFAGGDSVLALVSPDAEDDARELLIGG